MNVAYTSSAIIQQMAFDHPGAKVENHDGAMFLSLRGVTWMAFEDVLR